jgi:hypothetical protein
MTDDTLSTMRADALRIMHATVSDSAAKPADKLRAAEAIIRASQDATSASGEGQAEDLDDATLLAIARGVHPPLMGPAGTSDAAVPSHAGTERSRESDALTAGGGRGERGPIPVPANRSTRGADHRPVVTPCPHHNLHCGYPDCDCPRKGDPATAADVPRETNPFLRRGTQNGPGHLRPPPPGLVLPGQKGVKGTQKGPARSENGPPAIARPAQLDDDVDPCS